jgi:hypothetical protein
MIYTTKTDRLQIVSTASPTEVDYIVTYDNLESLGVYGKISSSGATFVDPIYPAPTTRAAVSNIVVSNKNATPTIITINKVVGGVVYSLFEAELADNERIVYEAGQWKVFDPNGGIKTASTATGDMQAAIYDPANITEQLVGETASQTLTNKRITPRWGYLESSATPAINTNIYDCFSITTLAVDITSMSSSLTGTPTNFQRLLIRIKDNGSPRAITWGASFEDGGVPLPTTTVASKVLTVGFIYDTVKIKWCCIASVTES